MNRFLEFIGKLAVLLVFLYFALSWTNDLMDYHIDYFSIGGLIGGAFHLFFIFFIWKVIFDAVPVYFHGEFRPKD